MPAYNEAGSVARALDLADAALSSVTGDYEIIVINDGSTDETGKKVAEAMKTNRRIRSISRKVNYGFGYSFREFTRVAVKKYAVQYHADADADPGFIAELVRRRNMADVVSIYPAGNQTRSPLRQFLSVAFISSMNSLSGLNLKYYNGAFICPLSYLRNIPIKSEGLTAYAEVKIRLGARGYKIAEIPFAQRPRESGSTKAVSWRSVKDTLSAVRFLSSDGVIGFPWAPGRKPVQNRF